MKNTTKPLGSVGATNRGFPVVDFEDCYGAKCGLQCSSIVGEYDDAFQRPGTSAVWLGIQDAAPKILASTGWVDYPIPEGVLLTTRMHLNREQVEGLMHQLPGSCFSLICHTISYSCL